MSANEEKIPQLICFEGPDGAGKSTQIELIVSYLSHLGYDVIVAREPGGTEIGQQLRSVFLDNQATLYPMSEILILLAAKAQMYDEVIGPALADGKVVVTDRGTDSLRVYQGLVKGRIEPERLDDILRITGLSRIPDLTIHIDVDTKIAAERMALRGNLSSIDKFGPEFHSAVAQGYRTLYEGREDVFRVDGNQSTEDTMADAIGIIDRNFLRHSKPAVHHV